MVSVLSAGGTEVRIICDSTIVNHGYPDSTGSEDVIVNELFNSNSKGIMELSLDSLKNKQRKENYVEGCG